MSFSLEHIVPEVIEVIKAYEKSGHCKIPVIAAGGLYTGGDIYRLMQLGATGVQLGSKFVTTEECDASPVFKQTYIDAEQSDIEINCQPGRNAGTCNIGRVYSENKIRK